MPARKDSDLLAAIEQENAAISVGGKCSFGAALKAASDNDREVLLNALGRYPATAIASALRKRGIDVKAQAIQRHRRLACNCSDDLR